jgi:signal transduction histidine kinase
MRTDMFALPTGTRPGDVVPSRRAPAGDDRVRAAGAVLAGEPIEQVAARHGVGADLVLEWARSLEAGGAAALNGTQATDLPRGPYAAGVAVQDYVQLLAQDLAAPLAQARSALAELPGMVDPRPAVGVAAASVAHAIRLTEQLSDVLQVTSGQVDLQPRGVDLLSVVRDACRRLGLAEPADGSDSGAVEADPARLRQIVDAVLGDALEHVRTTDVTVGVRSLGSSILLTVRLAGVSLSLTAGSGPVARGEGLALYVARALVLASGGRIGVTGHGEPADADRATVLWVRLPAATAPDAATPPRS